MPHKPSTARGRNSLSTLMLQKLQKFAWQGGPKTGAAIVLEYVSEPVAGPTQPRRACAI